jgi:riboflavin transporter
MGDKRLQNLVRSSLLLAIVIVIQVIGKNIPAISQSFVGPGVNAVLIIAAALCGNWWGAAVGSLTPVLAWVIGQLAAPMGPFVPFIIIGNIIYVLSFGLLKKYSKGKYIGVVVGSILKYGFLSLSASKLVALFKLGMPEKVVSKLIVAMGIPQLITALIGGFVALVLIEILRRRKI